MQDLRWLVRQFEHSDEKVQIDTADLPRLAAVKTGRLGKAVERLCSLRPIVAADQADLCNEVWGLWQSSADAILMEPKHTSSDAMGTCAPDTCRAPCVVLLGLLGTPWTAGRRALWLQCRALVARENAQLCSP